MTYYWFSILFAFAGGYLQHCARSFVSRLNVSHECASCLRPHWLRTEPYASIIFEGPAQQPLRFRYGLGLLELSHQGLLSAVEAEMSGQQWDYCALF